MGLQPREGNGGLKRQPPEKGETASKRLKLGRLQRKILGFILQSGLRTFKPSMIPVHHNGKEVAEALARLAHHGIVRRLSHGYYAADLDKIKQLSVSRKLEFPPIQQKIPLIREPQQKIPPIRGLAPTPSPPTTTTQPTHHSQPTNSTRSTPRLTTSKSSKPSTKPNNPIPPNSVACSDKKLSKHIDCNRRRGVVINCNNRPDAAPPQEILYDNVRGKTPQGYHYGDKGRLLRAEDLARFFATTRTGIDHLAIDYAELTVPTHSDYLEEEGVVKIYYKCVMVDDCELCSEFVEWMPPKHFIKEHGIARANYHFRKYILLASLKVLRRAIDILSRRLN